MAPSDPTPTLPGDVPGDRQDDRAGTDRHTVRELIDQRRRHWPQATSYVSDLAVGFLRMNALVREAGSRAMSRLELTPPEFDVLVSLRMTPPPHVRTPGELYRSLLISAGGITYLLGQLEKKGFVARETLASDRRVKPVRLTQKGLQRVESAMREVQREARAMFESGLSESELLTLRDALYELLDGAEARPVPARPAPPG